jgi:hypothetical protein
MPAPSRRPGHVRPSRGGKEGLSAAAPLRLFSSGSGDEYLRKAAEVVARAARTLAAGWSRKIPASVYVTVDGNVATVHAAAPDARPAEFRLDHPLFGDREHWYGPPGTPFLAPALHASIDEAMREYEKKVVVYARKLGWK